MAVWEAQAELAEYFREDCPFRPLPHAVPHAVLRQTELPAV